MLDRTINSPSKHTFGRPAIDPPLANAGMFAGLHGIAATPFSYKKDEEIYGEGEPTEFVYQVVTGAVRTYKLLSDGRRQIGAFLLPGDVFGLDSETAHRLSAEAIVDTTVQLVKHSRLERLAETNVQVARKLWAMTASDLHHAEDHMLLLGRKTAMERVATFLLEMDRRLARVGMVTLPMCRKDISDYLGLTIETVSRALSQLNDQGILEFSGARQIVLRNRMQLATLDA